MIGDNNQNSNLNNGNGIGNDNNLNATLVDNANNLQNNPFNQSQPLNNAMNNNPNYGDVAGVGSINNIGGEVFNIPINPAPMPGIPTPPPMTNQTPQQEGVEAVGAVPSFDNEVTPSPKKGILKKIAIVLIILVVGLLGGGYYYINTDVFIVETSIDNLFNTTENLILDFEDFNSGFNDSKDYEITNNITMDSNIENLNEIFGNKYFSLKTTSQVSDNKIFSNVTLNYDNNEVISADISLEEELIKFLLNCYDDILVADASDYNLEEVLNVERINEIKEELSIENALYINEFIKNTLKESINYDNVTKEKTEVTLNNEVKNVIAHNYNMPVNETAVVFVDAIKNDSKLLNILSLIFDISESEVINHFEDIRESILDYEKLYINYTFYTSGLLNDLVGGEIKSDESTLTFYVDNDVIYYEIISVDDVSIKLIGELNQNYYTIGYINEEGKEEVSIKFNFSNTDYSVNVNVDRTIYYSDFKFNIESGVHKNSENDYTSRLYVSFDDEYLEVALDTVINYDFEFNFMPSKNEVYFDDLAEDSYIELMKSIVYSFEDTPFGEILIAEYESLLVYPDEDLVENSIYIADAVSNQVLTDEMKGNQYDCYTIAYLINNKIISGIEPSFGTYSGYDGIVYVNRLTETITLYEVSLIDYTNKLYISQYKSGLTLYNVKDYNYDYILPTCEGYNSPS